mmetsp:Transcript_68228/g.200349  ORF Transcript_68228/g.200349 Transcript_68228/m.200349 type:complete len:371 (-) Transcript_68228:119-1231(-)
MDEQLLTVAVDHVLLNLRDVVRDVVDDLHVEVLRALVEHLRERLPREEGHGGPVHPGVVRRGRHGGHVVLALLRVDPGASQLPVVRVDVVARHSPLHLHEGVRGDLVPQASAPRVDHYTHLTLLVYAHLLRHEGVVDLVHHLDLSVVVAGPQRPQLRQPALFGAAGDLARICVQHAPVLLAVLLVLGPRVALAERPVDAELQRLLQVLLLRRDDAHGPDADRDVVEQRLRKALLDRLYVRVEQIRAHQSHAAVDVEADATGRDDRLGVAHVEGRHVADREAVPAVHVRQADRVLADARQRGHVADLLDRRQEPADIGRLPRVTSQLVEDELLQSAVDVKPARHVHAWDEALLDRVHVRRLLLDEAALSVI